MCAWPFLAVLAGLIEQDDLIDVRGAEASQFLPDGFPRSDQAAVQRHPVPGAVNMGDEQARFIFLTVYSPRKAGPAVAYSVTWKRLASAS
jgi:hypothetical protein